MKYFAAAALASMAAANPALLDNVLGNSLSDVVANADVVVPAGLELNLLLNGPKSPPPADRIYIWHPAHPARPPHLDHLDRNQHCHQDRD
ncbi:hypothetical protein PWT90_07198 [Aphanocladium album]|nr:hypothetical protein PWT90_07198 [Aphanocladium album]